MKEHHPYDEPEVVALPVAGGSASYLDWVRRQAVGSAGVPAAGASQQGANKCAT